MPEPGFFALADIKTSLFWIAAFVTIVAIGIIWHLRAKKALDAKQGK